MIPLTAHQFELVPLEDCLDEAIRFRNSNRSEAREPDYFRWRYLSRPGNGRTLVAWASRNGLRIGAATIATQEFSLEGRIELIGVIGDISIAADSRGTGLGHQLLDYVGRSLNGIVHSCIVLPNAAALSAARKAGWLPACKMYRFVRPLMAHHPKETRSVSRPRGAVSRILATAMEVVDTVNAVVLKEGTFAEELSLGQDFDFLWNSVNKERLLLARRSREYLDWRYLNHPLQKFRMLTFRVRGKLEGYAVVHDDGGSMVIDDYLIADHLYGLSMGLRLIAWAKQAQFNDIQLRLAPPNDLGIPWRRLGFFRRGDSIQVMTSPQHDEHNVPVRAGSWFMTIGDKDV